MKIEYIILNNFRNFYGAGNKIEFPKGDNHITVIHAKNGGGKSTILNAFTWALYDVLSKSLRNQKIIPNKRAIAETETGETVSAVVEIQFSHNGRTFRVKKTQTATRIDSTPYIDKLQSNTTISSHNGDGNWNSLIGQTPEDVINGILPKDLHNYFFFDGERITAITGASKTQKGELRNAATKLLGLVPIDRGITHLTSAVKTLEKELGDSGNNELKNLLERKDAINKTVEGFKKRNTEINKEIGLAEKRVDVLDKKLLENKDTSLLQKRRSEITDEIDKKLKPKLEKVDKGIKQHISKFGYKFFMTSLLQDCSDKIEQMRDAGELPKGIKRQFVDDLLNETKECICGTHLIEGSEPWTKVSEWREKAGLEDVEQRAISIGASIKTIAENNKDSFETLHALKVDKIKIKQTFANLERELEKISEKLQHVPEVDIAAIERSRQTILLDIDNLSIEYNEKVGSIKTLRDQIKEIENKINKVETKVGKIILTQKRIQATREAIEAMSELYNVFHVNFKKSLETKMREIYRSITDLAYIPTIDDKFAISLEDKTTGLPFPVGQSTGQGQVLSVAFILGIISEARHHTSEHQKIVPQDQDSTYPLVMDSPFGTLDSQNRHGVASHMAKVADQSIILVSDTQSKEVVEAVAEYDCKHCYLTYHNPRATQDLIKTINGKEVVLVKPSEQYETSTIEEL